MFTQHHKPTVKPRAKRIPGICAAADALGISRGHLYEVLKGNRKAKPTMDRYRALKAKTPGPFHNSPRRQPAAPKPLVQFPPELAAAEIWENSFSKPCRNLALTWQSSVLIPALARSSTIIPRSRLPWSANCNRSAPDISIRATIRRAAITFFTTLTSGNFRRL